MGYSGPETTAGEGDAVIPVQFFSPPRPLQAEQALMLAVITEAISCLWGVVDGVSSFNQRLREQRRAYAWIIADDEHRPGVTFAMVCALLHLNESRLRSALIGVYRSHDLTNPTRLTDKPPNRRLPNRGDRRTCAA